MKNCYLKSVQHCLTLKVKINLFVDMLLSYASTLTFIASLARKELE